MKALIVVGYNSPMIEAARRAVEAEGLSDIIDVRPPSKPPAGGETPEIVVLYTPTMPRWLDTRSARIIAPAAEELAGAARGPAEVVARLTAYVRMGGVENLRLLARYIAYLLGLGSEEPPPPRRLPWHGIWHPRLGLHASTSSYLEHYGGWGCYAGILFHRSWWLYGNTEPVEALVEALEGEGVGAVPVFTTAHRGPMGEPSAEDSIREFLLAGGRPVVDVAVDMLSFLLLDHGGSGEGVELLKRLGVPVVKAVRDSRQSIREWLGSTGITPQSLIYEVVMPELDGVIEPVLLAGSVRMEGWRRLEAYRPHARYIARRVKAWSRLRRKPPSERRIALILNNPPCKMLEATVGVALGLDALETVVRILHRLRGLGYRVEGRLPASGQELADMILEKRAVSEFRWTSPRDIVERGGCLALIPVEKYMEWFNELPEEKRREMIEWWGDPRRPSGPLAAALYKGCFVVPGLRFGNIVVMPQPKFGCAGPACDGTVCKILHNPRVPPPHQWLAVYRWVTRVFDADLIIHVGTHGSLEFRPGKRVGLSPLCWPEITIDDKPFAYIYAVTNPMEAVVAKRRAYAVIVDHVHPPLELRLEGLEALEEALNEYREARGKGDEARAAEALKRLREEASKAGIPLPGSLSGEELAEEVHRFIDRARMSMVEHGLHVFGDTSPRTAASTAVAIVSHGPPWPPLIDRLEEWLRGRGVCSHDCRGLAARLAEEALAMLLQQGVQSGMLTPSLLAKVLEEATSRLVGA
ncbi:MAG: hypothetical protein GXO09_04445 [Crenarchaeota archaeon]|nr:hypothetical protein [Thermoproteota archaeon]